MEVQDKIGKDSMPCMKCKAAVSHADHGCPACGYTLEGVRLYNPKHFLLLALLLTAMVPIFLAASNWGRIGKTGRRNRWLLIAFVCFILFFGVLILLPDSGMSTKYLGYLINLPIGWILREKQQPVYAVSLVLGAKPASIFFGSIKGFALALLALLISAAGFMAYMIVEENRAVALYEEGRCEEAASIFEKLLRREAEDDKARFGLALCHVCMERWEDAANGFRAYLKRNNDDPVAHAFLGYVLQEQGQQQEAEEHFNTAVSLDPKVLTELFEPK